MLIIGESLNATRQEVRTAVENQDVSFVQALAREQITAGADMLDVNAAVAGRDEVEDLPWMVKTVQEVVDFPLVLDSSNIDALVAAMKVHRGRPMINSLTAKKDSLERLLPVVAGEDCSVIVLCMDDDGIPSDVEGRLNAARAVVLPLLAAGKKRSDIYVDPLVMSISVDPSAAKTTLEVIKRISAEEMAGVQITGGLSNVSFGMPGRKLLNRTFLTMAMTFGLNSCIVDVRDKELMSAIYAARAFIENGGSRDYLKAFRQGKLSF
ncbi:MAG: dihydropteroate synthase [Bacillota bacterium]